MIEQIGNYKITEEIGSGGMAVVYKGVQESLRRTVAIKALKTSLSADKNIVARFEREAFSVASFQHENIITLYDFFRERGALFMVMEYVEGIDVYDLLERCQQVPLDIAAIVSLQIARALDYAHFRGVIHRDVKPANIILSKYGEVKLTDFGIAHVKQSDLTEAGIGLGTPAYMSPEQIVGDRLDHRTDIWSLGVLLYQMVTGKKPFIEDDQISVVQAIRLEQPPLPRSLNPKINKDLERIILKCMRKAQEDRYGSTQDLVIALEQYLAAHVTMNYRVRMVNYLHEQELLSSDETTAMLHPALVGNEGNAAGRHSVRQQIKHPLVLLAIATALVGGVVAGASYGQLFAKAAPPQKPPVTICADAPPTEGETARGQLRVLAHPWAHVQIDGQRAATTPHPPLSLAPGSYKVRLSNPYGFAAMEREVKIEANKINTVTVVLERAEATSSGGSQ